MEYSPIGKIGFIDLKNFATLKSGVFNSYQNKFELPHYHGKNGSHCCYLKGKPRNSNKYKGGS